MDNYTIAKKILETGFFIRRNYNTHRPPYLLFRGIRPLIKLYNRAWRKFNSPSPWTSPASIRIFDKILDAHMTGFEFGSGASTIYFAGKLGELVSVEHDKTWYNLVKVKLASHSNVDYFLLEPTISSGKPDYSNYAEKILEYPDDYFDFVLIDGRARVNCTLNSLSKLKSNGILVLDNSERDHYMKVFEILKEWKQIHTTSGLTDTTFWFKP